MTRAVPKQTVREVDDRWGRVRPPGLADPVRLSEILQASADRFGLDPRELLSTAKARPLPEARAVFSGCARHLTSHSYPEIARILGRHYHSTIHTAERRFQRLDVVEQLEIVEDVLHRVRHGRIENGDGRRR